MRTKPLRRRQSLRRGRDGWRLCFCGGPHDQNGSWRNITASLEQRDSRYYGTVDMTANCTVYYAHAIFAFRKG